MSSRRFAFTASDRYLGVVKAFIERGWEPVKLFTAPIYSHMADNKMVIDLSQQRKLPIQLSPMTATSMAQLQDMGCDLLVLASYQWRIGDWSPYLPRAINFHPAPLPQYRGPYPMVLGILDGRPTWATTCHKVAAEFDTGDIIAAREFIVSAQECHESLDLKTQIETMQLAAHVAQNIDTLWDQAVPQTGGNYVPMWTDANREIDFSRSAAEIDLQLRAFGNFECLATVNNVKYHVRRALCWAIGHNCTPGTLAYVDGTKYVIACKDGFVALLDWYLFPPGFLVQSQSR